MIVRKNQPELEKMRAAGLLVYKVLSTLKSMVAEGVSTYDLEVAAEKMITEGGARAAFKGYPNPAAGSKFPFVLCVSVTEEDFEERRYCFDRYWSPVERLLRGFGDHGSGG